MYLTTVLVLAVLGYTNGLLPPFITPCSLSDPQLNECALKNARQALPIISKGNKSFKIPNLAPVHVPLVTVNGNNLQIKFTDITSKVLSIADISQFSIDDNAKKWSLTAVADVAEFLGNYEIKGQILVLPINGQGAANVTYSNPKFIYSMKLKEIEKNGDSYLDFVSSESEFKFERAFFKFDNLFGGDPRLGAEMNVFLNENWQDFEKELHPVVVKTMTGIAENIFKNVFSRVPKKEMFLQ